MQQDDQEVALLQRIAAQAPPQDIVHKEPRPPADPLVWDIPGFGAGARVMTSFGPVPVEALRRRDPVKTHTGQFLEVKFVDEIQLDRRFLLTHAQAQPVFIPRGSMGAGSPTQNVLASSSQKVRSPGRFDQNAGHPAGDLVGRGGIARKSFGYFTYYVFHCGLPCTVNVDGLWVDLDPGTLEPQLH